jgi:glyoxylase-like metal-dependent hydrolase (beta-lactamase superfamily II)
MSVVVFILALGLLLPATAPAQTTDTAEDMPVSVTRLSDRVTQFSTAGDEPTVVTAIRSRRGIIVVDTERAPTFTAAIRRAIEAEVPGVIVYLINTHGHGDHTYGNQVFADATLIAHHNAIADMEVADRQRERLAQRFQAGIQGLKARYEAMDRDSQEAAALAATISYYEQFAAGLGESFELTLPDITFSDRLSLDLGDLTLELIWFGKAHTDGDVLIYCPEEQLLLTGDLFYSGGFPYVDSERVPSLGRWHETLTGLLQRDEGVTHVATGHEPSLPVSHLEAILEFVAEQQARFAGRESALNVFREVHEADGIASALDRLREMNARPDEFYVLHAEFDTYVYRLMLAEQLDEALEALLVLAELFPQSDVAFDSLGEVYVRLEDTDSAIESFRRALELNPENENAARRLRELGG